MPQGSSNHSSSREHTAVRLGDVPEDSGDGLRFIQDRLALFGKTIFWISCGFLVMSIAFDAFHLVPAARNARESHLAASAIALFVWMV
ncbi:MAG TPA: hypothetical protein VIM73_15960, partial [Polyangiaceae bacterium]